MWQRILFNFRIGSDAIQNNRFRTILTSLGMIFGVAAVIVLMAMGKGTEKEILDQIKLVGSNNIIIKPAGKETTTSSDQDPQNTGNSKRQWSPGLTLDDAENIRTSIEEVESVSPEIELSTLLMQNGISKEGKVMGVNAAYFSIANIELEQGKAFNATQLQNALPVCIIGKGIRSTFFAGKTALGEKIKCGDEWFTVIGILKERDFDEKNATKLSVHNDNQLVFIPVTTYLLYFGRRENSNANNTSEDDGMFMINTGNSTTKTGQLDRIIARVKESSAILPVKDVIDRMLKRRHHQVNDYEIVIPELLLKQEQQTKERFNFLILIIGGISLVVGGIGIMNIMLASVTERTKEIGIRQALGATRQDIIQQFLAEAVTISVIGGSIGIILGFVVCISIEKLADVHTIITVWSVGISFFISVLVGVFSGFYPARKASTFDPVVSLRYE